MNWQMIIENEFEGKWKEAVVTCSKYCSTLLEELKESKKISVCRQRLGRPIFRKHVRSIATRASLLISTNEQFHSFESISSTQSFAPSPHFLRYCGGCDDSISFCFVMK
jgi:hypothetical protein